MSIKAWLYFGFTTLLSVVLLFIIVHYFRKKRREKVEQPKYRMMDED